MARATFHLQLGILLHSQTGTQICCFSRTGSWLEICTGACPLPQAHKLMVEMFSSKQLLKIIINIISHLILHLYDYSVYFLIYLLDNVYGGICQSAFAATQPQNLSGLEEKHTFHSQSYRVTVSLVSSPSDIPLSSPAQAPQSAGFRLGSAGQRHWQEIRRKEKGSKQGISPSPFLPRWLPLQSLFLQGCSSHWAGPSWLHALVG